MPLLPLPVSVCVPNLKAEEGSVNPADSHEADVVICETKTTGAVFFYERPRGATFVFFHVSNGSGPLTKGNYSDKKQICFYSMSSKL